MFDAACLPDQVNISAIAAYAASNLLPLPSIRSIIDEARVLARDRGRALVGARDVKQALTSRQRSDLAIRSAFRLPADEIPAAAVAAPPGRSRGSAERRAGWQVRTDYQFFAQRRRRRAGDSYAFSARHPHRPIAAGAAFLTRGDLTPHLLALLFRTWDIRKADKLSAKLQKPTFRSTSNRPMLVAIPVTYFEPAFLLAAQRAFISSESLFRPAGVSAPFFRVEAFCFPPAFLLAAQRAFISWESFLRPAGVSRPFLLPGAAAPVLLAGAAPPVPRLLAQRALAAAASFALVAGEKNRPAAVGAVGLVGLVGL